MIFGKNLMKVNVCFDFLYNFCIKYFSFLEEFSNILTHMYAGIQVKYLLLLIF